MTANRPTTAVRTQEQIETDEYMARFLALEEDERIARKLQSDIEAGTAVDDFHRPRSAAVRKPHNEYEDSEISSPEPKFVQYHSNTPLEQEESHEIKQIQSSKIVNNGSNSSQRDKPSQRDAGRSKLNDGDVSTTLIFIVRVSHDVCTHVLLS